MSGRTELCIGLAAGIAVLAGCTAAQEETGSIKTHLVATGPDGATYRLPANTFLLVSGQSQPYDASFYLDGDAPVLTVVLPVGDFSAELWNFFNDYQDQWPLERTNLDSSTETVIATLVTPNPSPVSIFPDTVTSLPLTFHVPEVGPITFDTGSLDVSLEVDAVAASTVEFELSGNFLVAPQFAPEAPADLPARLPQSGDIESANFWVRLSGGWAVRGPGTVCAAATIRQFAWQSDGFADSVREDGGTTPDTATLCLTDMGSLEFTSVSVQLRRIAVPTTPTFTGLLSPDPEMVFSLNMSGYLSTRVFVDQTLDLSPAVGTHDGNLFLDQYLYLSAPDPVDWTFWYYGGYQAANNGVTPLGQVTVTPIP